MISSRSSAVSTRTPRVGDVRFLEDLAPPAVAAHQLGTAEARVVGLADGVDDDNRELGLVRVFENTRTHPSEDVGTISDGKIDMGKEVGRKYGKSLTGETERIGL